MSKNKTISFNDWKDFILPYCCIVCDEGGEYDEVCCHLEESEDEDEEAIICSCHGGNEISEFKFKKSQNEMVEIYGNDRFGVKDERDWLFIVAPIKFVKYQKSKKSNK